MSRVKYSEVDIENLARELYRSHHNASEAAFILDQPYQKIGRIYQKFKLQRVKQYSRLDLLEPLYKIRIEELQTAFIEQSTELQSA